MHMVATVPLQVINSMRCFILFCFTWSLSFSQNLFESHFVKKNVVLFRLLPKDRKVYDEMMNGPLKISRIDVTNAPQKEMVLIDALRNYHEGDTLNWLRLRRKNK